MHPCRAQAVVVGSEHLCYDGLRERKSELRKTSVGYLVALESRGLRALASADGGGKGFMMATDQTGNDVTLRQLALQPVLCIRATIRVEQLGEVVGDRIQALWDYLEQSGAQPAGPAYVRYYTFGDTETDMETGLPVVEPVAGAGRIAAGTLPGGPAIVTEHFGPHQNLGEAYARLAAWLQAQGREPDGAIWEVYYWIDPSRNRDRASGITDPATSHVELVQPIKPAAPL